MEATVASFIMILFLKQKYSNHLGLKLQLLKLTCFPSGCFFPPVSQKLPTAIMAGRSFNPLKRYFMFRGLQV